MRLFIAVELDHPGKRALSKLIERIERLPGKVRWCRSNQMHLTLSFLGSTPAERVAEIAQAMERAVRAAGHAGPVGPFEFGLRGLGGFPNLRRPKVLWVGVDEPTGALCRLQAALTAELTALGIALEDRPFSPHITLGRVKQLDRRGDYEAILSPQSDFTGPDQLAEQLLLISSEMHPDGPHYSTVATIRLGGE